MPATVIGMSYGMRLEEALKLAKKDRAQLAEALGVSVQSVGQIILGKTKAATAENCARSARFLRVDMHWLATGEGVPRPRPLSPLALDLATQFDARVPVDKRKAVHAHLMGTIDLAIPAPLPIVLAAPSPTDEPQKR